MKEYTSSAPVFSGSIQVVETTDPAHADNINAAPKQLLQNTLALYTYIEELSKEETIEAVFKLVFTKLPGEETDTTAMTAEEIEEALAMEWSGESSEDETAMSAGEVEEALATEWNGESSDDVTAMSAADVEEATS